MMSIGRFQSNGKVIPVLAHTMHDVNGTILRDNTAVTYVKVLSSMLGSDIYYLGSEDICVRYLLMENRYSRALGGLHPFNGALNLTFFARHMSSSRSYWCTALNSQCDLPSDVTITLIQREVNRRILNIDLVCSALRSIGWYVNVLYLEKLSISDQFRAVQNSTTIIGYHGAGLSWSRWTHPDAAEIQLIGFPCIHESHSSMKFKKRYSIQHAALNSIGANLNQTLANLFCEVIENKVKKSELTPAEKAYYS
jgi:hypothetical protein